MKKSKFLAYHLLITTIILILLGVVLNWSLLFSFISANIYSIIILNYNNYDIRTLLKTAFAETIQYKLLYLTIMLIGATVAIWLSSGTIATMIYYGFNYIDGINFLLFAFLVTTICSFFMGTAVGTFSTIGLILYSIGMVIGIPSPLIIGAIVSGSFISDKISPISGLVNINLKVSEVNYNNALCQSLKTLIPSILITALFYYFRGQAFVVQGHDQSLLTIQGELQKIFCIHPALFCLPVVILLLSIIGINSLYTILTGIFLGSIFSYLIQKLNIVTIINILLFGYSSSIDGPFSNILKGGGLLKMLEVSMIVASAVFLVSIFIKSGIIDTVIGNFVSSIRSSKQLLRKTGLLSIFITAFTCDQTIGIVLPSNLLKSTFDKYQIKREVLFRTLSDTGVIVAPLFPWNINYLIIVSIIGKNTSFIPYATLCYITPLLHFIITLIPSRSTQRE